MKTDAPIHVHRNGITEGPFSLHEIFENLANGGLSDTDQVWDGEANEWVLIRDVFPRNGHGNVRSVAPPPLEQSPSQTVAIPAVPDKPSPYKRIRLGFILLLALVGVIVLAIIASNLPSKTNVPTTDNTTQVPSNQPSGNTSPATSNPPSDNTNQVTSIPASATSEAESQAEREQAENEVIQKVTCRAFGTVIQRLDNGYLIHAGLFTGQWETANGLILQSFVNNPNGVVEVKDYFVSCDNPTLVDDDHFDSIVYVTDNVFSYTNTLGAQRSVHTLTLSKDDALSKLKDQIDARQAELAGAARQAAQELESNFVDHLNDTVSTISAGNLDHAQELFTVAEQLKPNDIRLNNVRAQLHKAQFQSATKLFRNAVQSKNIADAVTALNSANGLAPNDPAIVSFQKQLDQLKDGVFQGIDSKLAAGDVAGADKDYSDLAASFPDESRLAALKAKILRAKFDSAVKSFSQALASQDTENASAKLDEAQSLIPDDLSLGTLQKELLEAKFAKSSAALNVFISNSQFADATLEMTKLQTLNIEPEKIASLSAQLSAAIKKAIISDVDRGKNALRSNDISGAEQALASAITLDAADPVALDLKKRIDVAKYSSAMADALSNLKRNDYSGASRKLNVALTIYPTDPVALNAKQSLSTLVQLNQAPVIHPDDFSGEAISTDKGIACNLAKAANFVSQPVRVEATISSIVEDHLVESIFKANGHLDQMRVQLLPEENVPTRGQTVFFYGVLETANYSGFGGVHCDIINAKVISENAISDLKQSIISTLSRGTSSEQTNTGQ